MDVIVMSHPDDSSRVAIITPSGELPMDEIIQRQVDTTKPYKVMSSKDLPSQEDDYFEAWQLANDEIIVNVNKAKDIHRRMLRQQRTERFTSLDISFIRAIEQGDVSKQQEIAIIKQKLRDLPNHPAIEAATTTSELRLLTVDTLLTM